MYICPFRIEIAYNGIVVFAMEVVYNIQHKIFA